VILKLTGPDRRINHITGLLFSVSLWDVRTLSPSGQASFFCKRSRFFYYNYRIKRQLKDMACFYENSPVEEEIPAVREEQSV